MNCSLQALGERNDSIEHAIVDGDACQWLGEWLAAALVAGEAAAPGKVVMATDTAVTHAVITDAYPEVGTLGAVVVELARLEPSFALTHTRDVPAK